MLACITKNGNLDSLGFAQLRFAAPISVPCLTSHSGKKLQIFWLKLSGSPKDLQSFLILREGTFQFGESRKGVMMVGLGLSVDLVGVVIWVGF